MKEVEKFLFSHFERIVRKRGIKIDEIISENGTLKSFWRVGPYIVLIVESSVSVEKRIELVLREENGEMYLMYASPFTISQGWGEVVPVKVHPSVLSSPRLLESLLIEMERG